MLRNILASAIILAASTTATADLADDLNAPGANSNDVITAALGACTDDACKADILEEALNAKVDATTVMSLALAANIPTADISQAMKNAGVSDADITIAATANNIDPSSVLGATAGGPQGGGDDNNSEETVLPGADVPPGIS